MPKASAICLLLALLPATAVLAAPPEEPPPTPVLRALLEPATACAGTLPPFDSDESARLWAFYQPLGHARAWSAANGLASLVEQLEALADDGLDPARYGTERLRQALRTPPNDPQQQACLDLQASLAYLQALQHLAHGQLSQDRLEPLWRAPEPEPVAAPSVPLLALDHLATPERAFAQARPKLDLYQGLRQAYAHLRRADLPDWQPIPAGPTLHPADADARVTALEEHLIATGYLAPDARGDGLTYHPALAAAVRAFQRQHGLQDDGIVGPATLEALNVSPASRLDQLRINLERLRWLAADVADDALLVDIAGARLLVYRAARPVWQTRVQVGRAARPTPTLKSRLSRLTLNPTWTVPPTILREDKLPQIRQDPGYLARHGLQVLDPHGQPLDPATVDWDNPRGIGLRQPAGEENPLGQVAIRFDNPYSVYLHDTPSQALFARAPRAFSSGCVRVEHALGLVDLLLSEGEHDTVYALLKTGQTHQYRLSRPLPVLMAYWTVSLDEQGQPLYRPDIYGRDPALLAALNAAQR